MLGSVSKPARPVVGLAAASRVSTHACAVFALLLGLDLAGCNSGPSENPDQSEPFSLKWFTPAQQVVGWPGTPAIVDGLVIFGSYQGLSAFRAETGAPVWRSALWTRPVSAFAKNIAVGDGRACMADQW